MLESARYFAERGYVFVAMDVRGRGDSDGEFTPYVNDGQDGYDTIEWCAAQSWSNGNVGTLGTTTEMAAAEQRIYHDSEHPSAIVLPIIPRV